MNVFNRIVTMIDLVLSIPLLLLIMLLGALPGPTVDALSGTLSNLKTIDLPARIALIVVSAILILVVLGLLWLEVRPTGQQTVRIRQVEGGEATMATEAVAQRLTYSVSQLADVIRVNPKIRGHGNSVDVTLDVETSPDVDVPAKTGEVVNLAREVVEQKMGLTLRKIVVNLHHAPYARRPTTAPPSLPPGSA